jgi:hypothetical protein
VSDDEEAFATREVSGRFDEHAHACHDVSKRLASVGSRVRIHQHAINDAAPLGDEHLLGLAFEYAKATLAQERIGGQSEVEFGSDDFGGLTRTSEVAGDQSIKSQ